MYAKVETPKENKSRAVANSVTQKKNNGKQGLGFEDNRLEAIAQRKLQEMANNSPQIKQIAQLHATVQRKVPSQGWPFKEIPNTYYQARGGQNIPFDKDKHGRGMFSFGTRTRQAVLEANPHEKVGDRIVSVRVITGHFMNPEGVQLDHSPSWDKISDAMDVHNKNLGSSWTAATGYSLWDAKMYYNDIDILQPAPGGINAAAGAAGVQEIPMGHKGVVDYLGEASVAWTNLQAGVEALGPGISDESAARIASLIHEVTTVMRQTIEQLL